MHKQAVEGYLKLNSSASIYTGMINSKFYKYSYAMVKYIIIHAFTQVH